VKSEKFVVASCACPKGKDGSQPLEASLDRAGQAGWDATRCPGCVYGSADPPGVMRKCFILKAVQVLCFDTLLQMFILSGL
jgi:hypothetical protein